LLLMVAVANLAAAQSGKGGRMLTKKERAEMRSLITTLGNRDISNGKSRKIKPVPEKENTKEDGGIRKLFRKLGGFEVREGKKTSDERDIPRKTEEETMEKAGKEHARPSGDMVSEDDISENLAYGSLGNSRQENLANGSLGNLEQENLAGHDSRSTSSLQTPEDRNPAVHWKDSDSPEEQVPSTNNATQKTLVAREIEAALPIGDVTELKTELRSPQANSYDLESDGPKSEICDGQTEEGGENHQSPLEPPRTTFAYIIKKYGGIDQLALDIKSLEWARSLEMIASKLDTENDQVEPELKGKNHHDADSKTASEPESFDEDGTDGLQVWTSLWIDERIIIREIILPKEKLEELARRAKSSDVLDTLFLLGPPTCELILSHINRIKSTLCYVRSVPSSLEPGRLRLPRVSPNTMWMTRSWGPERERLNMRAMLLQEKDNDQDSILLSLGNFGSVYSLPWNLVNTWEVCQLYPIDVYYSIKDFRAWNSLLAASSSIVETNI